MTNEIDEDDPALEEDKPDSTPIDLPDPTKAKRGRPKGSVKESPQLLKYRRQMQGRRESDIFAGPQAGKKYVIYRKQPEYSPQDGSWIAGYQQTHEPPFDLNTLKMTYGGGVYLVQRFEDGDLTNSSEVAIAGAPRETRTSSPSGQTAPAVAPSPGSMPPLTIRDVVDLAERLRPPPPVPPPAPPSMKEQLEMLVMVRDVAKGAFGDEKKTGGEGWAGIVSALPEKAILNLSEAALTLVKNFGSALTGHVAPQSPAALPAPATNGEGTPMADPRMSPWEPLAAELKKAVLQGASTGDPTPEALATNLLALPQAPMLLPLLKKHNAHEIIAWLKTQVNTKTQTLLDREEIRNYLTATVRELRRKSHEPEPNEPPRT